MIAFVDSNWTTYANGVNVNANLMDSIGRTSFIL
ncbi:MAG: hypothetical protein RLZZ262_1035 [Bacteroidota bacterium]|jgi:hypothetical protein